VRRALRTIEPESVAIGAARSVRSRDSRVELKKYCLRLALFALPLMSTLSVAQAQVSPEAMAEYRRKLRDYTLASQSYESEAAAYWSTVVDKRRERSNKRRNSQSVALDDYVLTQPPVYTGPPRPIDPSAPDKPPPQPRDKKYVPTIPEMLDSARRFFQFVPQRPANESEFKRAYARAVAAEGVPADIAIRLYAFETGGNGTHDVQSGLLNARPGAKPLSPAVGYNQLLITYTMHLLADQGDDFIRALQAKAQTLSGPQREATLAKIAALRRMVAFSRTVPADWNSQEKLGETQQGWGVQAALLDVDIGPLLQARKLTGSFRFARMRGHRVALVAAALEEIRRRHPVAPRLRHGDDVEAVAVAHQVHHLHFRRRQLIAMAAHAREAE
jgi:hypothetical protein